MSFTLTVIGSGLGSDLTTRRLGARGTAFAIALPLVPLLSPRVRALVAALTDRRALLMNTQASHPATFALGGDLHVNRLGFGAMRLTGQPGNFGPDPGWEGGWRSCAGPPSWA
jgi:hypothetical protein